MPLAEMLLGLHFAHIRLEAYFDGSARQKRWDMNSLEQCDVLGIMLSHDSKATSEEPRDPGL